MSDHKNNRTSSISVGKKIIFSLLVPILFISFAELFLSFFALERFDREFMPQSNHPIFVIDKKSSPKSYVTSSHFSGHLNSQTFSKNKQAGLTRIFVVGGSAAYAWPYTEEYGFSGYLRRALEEAYPGKFEIINAAGMSYGSHRVLDVLKDIISHEADLVIVYSGNNEFVERNILPSTTPRQNLPPVINRIRNLLADLNIYRALRLTIFRLSPDTFRPKFLDDITDIRSKPSVARGSMKRDPDLDQEISRNFQKNITAMKELLIANGIKGIFCTVPTSLNSWTPTSANPQFTGPTAAEKWHTLQQELNSLSTDRGSFDRRVVILSKMQQIAPDHPYVAYKMGQALTAQGQYAPAYLQFVRAKDLDERPVRALSSFNDFIRTTAGGSSILLTDLEELVGEIFKSGATTSLFIDYCHLNENAHRVAALKLLPAISQLLGNTIDLKIVGDLIYKDDWQTRPKEDKLQAGIHYAAGLTHLNNRQLQRALESFNRALAIMPLSGAYDNLGHIYLAMGEVAESRKMLLKAIEIDPSSHSSLISLGNSFLNEENFAEAAEFFTRAIAINNFAPAAYLGLADIALQKSDAASAISNYGEALRYGGDSLRLRKNLGLAQLAANDIKGARISWEAALKFDFSNREIRELLEKNFPPR